MFLFKRIALLALAVCVYCSIGRAGELEQAEDSGPHCGAFASPPEKLDTRLRAQIGQRNWDGLSDTVKDKLVLMTIAGQRFWVYQNANLSINITHGCNASCGFCVDAMRAASDCSTPAAGRITKTDLYLSRTNRILSDLASLQPSVSITGGEPTLDVRLPDVLDLLKKYNVRKRVITTNGSFLLTPSAKRPGKRVLDLILENPVHHLNISRAHYDEQVNQEIMKIEVPKSQQKPGQSVPFSNADLAQVVSEATSKNVSLRLSCALLKEGVHDLAGIHSYLDWAHSMGVKQVIFRQLMEVDTGTLADNHVSAYYKGQNGTVQLDPIFKQLDSDAAFTFFKQHVGYYYYVELYRYKGMTVVFEISDLRVLDRDNLRRPKMVDGVPVLYEMIYHDSGVLNGTWNVNRDVISTAQPASSTPAQ